MEGPVTWIFKGSLLTSLIFLSVGFVGVIFGLILTGKQQNKFEPFTGVILTPDFL
jgi:hypothetical protein